MGRVDNNQNTKYGHAAGKVEISVAVDGLFKTIYP